jgi:mRNA interferase HigB
MRVIKPTRIKQYALQYPDAAEALMNWLEHTELADWQNLADVRRMFPHADPIVVKSWHTATVFNIRGNNYRLITAIKYQYRIVYVLRFLTHKQYDKEKWKAEL